MPWVSPVLLRRRVVRRGYDILWFTSKDVTDEDVGLCKGVGMWHPGLQIVLENLRISQIRQKSYSIVLFCGFMWHLSGVSSSDACAMFSKWNRTLNSGVFLSSLTLPICVSSLPSSDVGRTKRPWRQCNGWWWENLPVLPILWCSLSSSSCNWRWSHN